MSIPKWISKFIDDGDVCDIEKAIKNAELSTSGEIVAVVVRRSSTVGHVFLTLFCLFWLFFFAVDVHFYQNKYFSFGNWIWFVYFIISYLFVMSFARFDWIQRVLTPQADLEKQVMDRAQLEFYQSKIKQTRDSTGILYFISLFEKKAVILADKTISDRLSPETWNNEIELMIDGIKNGEFAKGVVQAITDGGNILKEHFPIQSDDINELSNQLIIKE